MARTSSPAADSRAAARNSAPHLAHDLTIEQLAAEVGMSVRNIRNHHSRGLLPPPEVRARVGYYNSEHVARLQLILDLQADGFNLAAIERLLERIRRLGPASARPAQSGHHPVRARDPGDHHRR